MSTCCIFCCWFRDCASGEGVEDDRSTGSNPRALDDARDKAARPLNSPQNLRSRGRGGGEEASAVALPAPPSVSWLRSEDDGFVCERFSGKDTSCGTGKEIDGLEVRFEPRWYGAYTLGRAPPSTAHWEVGGTTSVLEFSNESFRLNLVIGCCSCCSCCCCPSGTWRRHNGDPSLLCRTQCGPYLPGGVGYPTPTSLLQDFAWM